MTCIWVKQITDKEKNVGFNFGSICRLLMEAALNASLQSIVRDGVKYQKNHAQEKKPVVLINY